MVFSITQTQSMVIVTSQHFTKRSSITFHIHHVRSWEYVHHAGSWNISPQHGGNCSRLKRSLKFSLEFVFISCGKFIHHFHKTDHFPQKAYAIQPILLEDHVYKTSIHYDCSRWKCNILKLSNLVVAFFGPPYLRCKRGSDSCNFKFKDNNFIFKF